MRIHTNKEVTREALSDAVIWAGRRAGQGMAFFQENSPAQHGSRTHAQAWDVKLEGDGTHSRWRINAGTADRDRYGDSLPYAATYDSWGWFLAHIFAVDPNAKCDYYSNAEDFHAKTKHAYVL